MLPRLNHLCVVLALLAACGRAPEWHFTNVTGMLPDLEFELVDSAGERVDASRFRGRVSLLFFGFTNCPGPCPTTLAQLGAARDAMGAAGAEVQVLMVTVDPGRDTPQALRRYEKSFGPWLHGLTGTPSELEAMQQAYKIYAQQLAADATGNYDVAHSTVVLAFDARGRCRLLISDASDTGAVAADLAQLVKS